jgi:NitT/TauT family transport system substrate-binding protein
MTMRRILAAVLVAGLGWPAGAQAQAADPVIVGWSRTAALAPIMIATDKGYFTRLGLAPDLQEFRGSADMVGSLATGQVDVVLGGVTAGFFNSVERGVDARVVAPMSIQPASPGLTPLMARYDLWEAKTIRTAVDLRGRKVSVNAPGNGVEYKLAVILQGAGMSLKDVDLTRLGFPEMMVALKTGAIDAAVLAQPFATVAAQEKLAVFMMKESEAGHGDVTTVVLFSGQFMRDKHAIAVRYLQGIIAGIRDVIGGKWRSPDNIAILTKYLELKPEIMLESVFPDFDPDLDIAARLDSLRRQEAVHMRNGYLQYQTPLAADRMIDTALAKEAVATMPKSASR